MISVNQRRGFKDVIEKQISGGGQEKLVREQGHYKKMPF
jgi:hypothetical protein